MAPTQDMSSAFDNLLGVSRSRDDFKKAFAINCDEQSAALRALIEQGEYNILPSKNGQQLLSQSCTPTGLAELLASCVLDCAVTQAAQRTLTVEAVQVIANAKKTSMFHGQLFQDMRNSLLLLEESETALNDIRTAQSSIDDGRLFSLEQVCKAEKIQSKVEFQLMGEEAAQGTEVSSRNVHGGMADSTTKCNITGWATAASKLAISFGKLGTRSLGGK